MPEISSREPARVEPVDPLSSAPRAQHRAALLEAPIVAVEAFRSSAVVYRRGQLAASSDGAQHLEIPSLPLALVDTSVRAAVEPARACAVIDLQVSIDVETPIEEHEVAERVTLKKLQREHRSLQQRRETLEEEIAQLLRQQPVLPPVPRSPDSEWLPSENPIPAWLALIALVRELASEKQQHLRDIVRQIRDLRDEIKRAEDAMASISTASTSKLQAAKKLELRLDSPPSAPCTVEISYQVNGARWVPTYELRVDPGGTRAELTIAALLGQVTGEDWSAVQLRLSTADLRRRSDLPRLPAMRIGRPRMPARRPSWRPLPDDLEQLFADFDNHRLLEPPAEPSDHAVTTERPTVAKSPLDAEAMREYHTLPPAQIAAHSAARTDSWDAAVAVEDDEDLTTDAYEPDEITQDDEEDLDGPTLSAPLAEPPPPSPAAPLDLLEAAPSLSRVSASEAPRRAKARAAAAPPLARSAPSGARSAPPRARSTPTELSLADELLSFGTLVLPPPSAPDRGSLRPAAKHELIPDEDQASFLIALETAAARHAEQTLELRTRPLPRWARAVEKSAGHFAHRYDAQGLAQIPADGQLHRVTIARQSVPVEICFRTVPRVEATVYRLATLANPLARPLLAGPLDIFWGNDFLVATCLKTTPVGAPIEANLGVEPRIKVARNVQHSEHETGLLAGRIVYEEQIDVEVKNGLGRPCVVDVIERVPVTEEKKLEVKVLREEPRAAEYSQKERQKPIRGGRRFRLQIDADAQQRVQLRYAMSLPAGSEISGGGRRA